VTLKTKRDDGGVVGFQKEVEKKTPKNAQKQTYREAGHLIAFLFQTLLN
jgi:hypothetical protein